MDAQTRCEIEALQAEFAWLIDRGDSSQVADLFTNDGRYARASGEVSVGREAIRLAYAARIAHGVRTSRHVFTNLRVRQLAPGRVHASSILTLYALDGPPLIPTEVMLVADYDDECVRGEDGRWRYASRVVTRIAISELMRGGLPLGISPR
jgi:uncharacterized protein (TIGR02246 family)